MIQFDSFVAVYIFMFLAILGMIFTVYISPIPSLVLWGFVILNHIYNVTELGRSDNG